MASIRKAALLSLLAYPIITSTDPGVLATALVGLGLTYVFLAIAFFRTILSPTRVPMLFFAGLARVLIGFTVGGLIGARTKRLGDIVRYNRDRLSITEAELEGAAAQLDRITAAFRAANRRLGRERMARGRCRIKALIAGATDNLRRMVHRSFTQRGVLRFFALAFGPVFLLLVTVFALAFLAAWKLNPVAFSSTPPVGPSLWQTWFFSITTVTTSALSPLRPDGLLVQALVSAELVSGAILVSALVSCFFAIHQSDLDESLRAWRYVEAELVRAFEQWQSEIARLEKERGYPDAASGDA